MSSINMIVGEMKTISKTHEILASVPSANKIPTVSSWSKAIDFINVKEPILKFCEAHGSYESLNVIANIWTSCNICVKEENEKKELEEKQAFFDHKFKLTGFSERFKNKTFKNFDLSANDLSKKDILCKLIEFGLNFDLPINKGKNFIFSGPPGTGKTHLACALTKLLIKQNKSINYCNIPFLFRQIKESWKSNSQNTESKIIAKMTKPDLLILDEFGIQYGSNFEKIVLFEILNERYSEVRSTLLISNLSLKGINEYLTQSIVDRLQEDKLVIMNFTGKSYRLRISNEK